MVDRDKLATEGELAIACECGYDAKGGLVMVDRYTTDYPPIPWCDLVETYTDNGMDPDDLISECPDCGEFMEVETCVERG